MHTNSSTNSIESDEESLDIQEFSNGKTTNEFSNSEEEGYYRQGEEALQTLITYTETNDEWNMIRNEEEIKCYRLVKDSRKVFKTEMIIPVSADRLWTVLYDDVGRTKEWNSNVTAIETVQKIDANTDVMYTLCPTIGPVSPRDFVTVRRQALIKGVHYDANVSTTHPSKPAESDPVRGENGIGGYVVIPMDTQTCKFIWVLETYFKGWLPQSLVEQMVPMSMMGTSKNLRNYLKKSAATPTHS